MQVLWNQFKHFKWKFVKVQRLWTDMPLHEYVDWHNCLLNCFYGGNEMSLTVTFLERTALLVQNISASVLSESVCPARCKAFLTCAGWPQDNKSWVAANCPGNITTLITPHGRGLFDQPVIWFPFRWFCSVSSMVVSLAPVEQNRRPWGLTVISLQAGSSYPAVTFGTPPCLHLDLHCFSDLPKPINHLNFEGGSSVNPHLFGVSSVVFFFNVTTVPFSKQRPSHRSIFFRFNLQTSFLQPGTLPSALLLFMPSIFPPSVQFLYMY